MFIHKIVILLAVCVILTAAATSVDFGNTKNMYEGHRIDNYVLFRNARSPKGGRVDFTVQRDQNGRRAYVNYNQNLFNSRNGRVNIDAFAQGNIDLNRNDFSGGIRGSFRF